MPRLTPIELATRRQGMGATDVVEALGLAPWEGAGPMRVYMAKTGAQVDDAATDEMAWGHYVEEALHRWYHEHHGEILPGGPMCQPEEPWLWATLDAKCIGRACIVEFKNVGPAMVRHWDESIEDGIPKYVRAQVTIGMFCAGVQDAHVIASVCGRPPAKWEVKYDPELGRLLVDGGRRFWERVQRREPPPLDATDATREYLEQRYPTVREPVIVEADSRACALGAERIDVAIAEGRASARKRVIDAELLAAVGDHDGIRGEGWKMTWKVGSDGKRRQRFTVST